MGQLKEGLAISTAATAAQFIHLRVRSAYSLLEGAIKAGKIPKMAADNGMPAVAVADRATLFAPPGDAAPLLQRLGVNRPYAVLCPGGGRHVLAGESASQRFGAVATRVAREGLVAVAVAAPTAAPAVDAGELPNAELMALRDAALGGLGIALLPDFTAQASLLAGKLMQVLPGWKPVGAFAEQLYAIRPYSAHVPRAVTAFVAHLREALAPGLSVER